ncbi:MAG: Gfo/Idh/MocA family oxidoreductase [Verrucomicrobiota bacterium]
MNPSQKSNLPRRTFIKGMAAAGAGVLAGPSINVLGAGYEVRVGVIGCGGKGNGHIKAINAIEGAKVVAFCDADLSRAEKAAKGDSSARLVQDYREILEMKDIDAITTATPNHWHAAMAVSACQAGKHVYVEKPVSHSLWEGQQMIAAARKYNRMVQGGTQQRSCPAPQECGKDLRAGKYGKVLWVHCMKLNQRGPIGFVTEPCEIPEEIDYNLWCGPAPDDPPMREKFHYDWHWQWNWGDGEMGNWAVHYTDDLCHMLGWDKLPSKVQSGGGRFVWKDNGETPNMMFSRMEYDGIPVIVETRNLPYAKGRDTDGVYMDFRGGNIIRCENALIKISRGGGRAYELDGKTVIKDYPGNAGKGHYQNFVEAIREDDSDVLNAEIATGHISSGMCHLANASYKLADTATVDDVRASFSGHEDAVNTIDSVFQQLEMNEASLDDLVLGPELAFDAESEQFTGDEADKANPLLRLPHREEFAIPDDV